MLKISKVLILLLMPLLLCSCWDFTDINKKAVALSIGVDYDNITENYIFSGEIANFSMPSGQQASQSKKINIFRFSSQGRTFQEAKLHYDNSIPMPIFLGGTTVVVFGKSFAEKSIEPYLNRIDGMTDYRKTLLAVVSKESPEDLFKFNINKSISVGTAIQENLEWLKQGGQAVYSTIENMLSSVSIGSVGYVVPYVGIEDNELRYLGLGIMKNSKLIDIIGIDETDGLLYLLTDKPILKENIPGLKNPNNILAFRSKLKKRKFTTDYIDNTPIININLDLNLRLMYQYYIESISKEEIKQLEDSISKKIKTDIQTIVTKSQKEYQCDIFDFVKYFRADCPKAYNSINWEQAYPTAKVNIVVSAKITNLNLYDTEAKIKTSEGKNNE